MFDKKNLNHDLEVITTHKFIPLFYGINIIFVISFPNTVMGKRKSNSKKIIQSWIPAGNIFQSSQLKIAYKIKIYGLDKEYIYLKLPYKIVSYITQYLYLKRICELLFSF